MAEIQTQISNSFLPSDLKADSWESLRPYFEDLNSRSINSVQELELWLLNRSKLEAITQEELGWRYINHTCDTTDDSKQQALDYFINKIEPNLVEFNDLLNRKVLENPFTKELNQDEYHIYLRGIAKEVEIFRKVNVPLQTELQMLANEYGKITGAMSVEIDGETMTFQSAANILKSEDRELRRSVYEKINYRRQEDREKLDDLFDKMLKIRHQMAINAGYSNFRDYMFDALGRFDYTPSHCEDFHQSIEQYIVPIVDDFDRERKSKLGFEKLFPWDSEVDTEKKPALKPFETSNELIDKTIECFKRIRKNYGDVISIMKEKGHLDLESRLGKAPGGYNYPLHQSSLPFIFMHATGSLRDMVTMMHEGGHALHSWLSKDLKINAFKHTPSEIAEVASMAMELISMDHWDVFFDDEDLIRAKRYQLEKILSILPWIASVDAFQHWVYTNPDHSRMERQEAWLSITRRFLGNIVDRSEYPEFESHSWHRQLHIFEVPFYYIEYGIAQLGAIGIWKNVKSDSNSALNHYENALSQGYMYSLPDLYKHAGIKFDFSPQNVKELAEMVSKELVLLKT
jgi:oligoendopeptidase F